MVVMVLMKMFASDADGSMYIVTSLCIDADDDGDDGGDDDGDDDDEVLERHRGFQVHNDLIASIGWPSPILRSWPPLQIHQKGF